MDASRLNWDFIKAQLPPGWRELAVEMGLIKPQPPQLHAKITDIEPILRLELYRAGLEASLRTTTAVAAAAKSAAVDAGMGDAAQADSLVDLSAPSLHGWERRLGPYFAALLAVLVNSTDEFVASRWAGYEVVLADGTTVTRPGAKGTTARVLYAMRLADMTLLKVLATDEHGSESLRVFEVKPQQLWICDRNYSNPEDVAWVVHAKGNILVRLNRGALPLYDVEEHPIDVMEKVRTLKDAGAMAEWPVWVHPSRRAPIPGRLCAVRLTEQDAEKGRQRLRREYGASVSPELLEAAAWLIVFTTAPRERLTTQQVLALYRLRWQMELEIKREKSIGGIDKLPNFRDDTIATWLYAKLLNQQIACKIIGPTVAFPPSAVSNAALAAVGAAALVEPRRGAREAAPDQAEDRRRDVARDGSRLPGAPRRAPAHRAA
jgi:hypothetical protein